MFLLFLQIKILHGWNMHSKQDIFQQVLIVQHELQKKPQLQQKIQI
jgi:hypothetical protein